MAGKLAFEETRRNVSRVVRRWIVRLFCPYAMRGQRQRQGKTA
nr:MAG TPA: hypothetical protein [Caudoviricetes sp.]